MRDELGKLVGQYVLGEELGRGGFGTVYRSVHPNTGRSVAVKVVPTPSPDVRARVANEFRAMSQLRSRHVMDVVDFVHGDDFIAVVYTYVDGESLDRLVSGGLTIDQALAVGKAAARGLAAAHERGIIHRDVKPSNILVPRVEDAFVHDKAIVMDFGVHGVLQPATGKTAAGLVVGTPAYMSPEQLAGQAQSPATDVYGLAAVLFEMLYHRPLYANTNVMELVQAIVHGEAEVPTRVGVPESLRALLARSLSKEMADRPRDAAAFLAELEAIAIEPGRRPRGTTDPGAKGGGLPISVGRGFDPGLPGRPGPVERPQPIERSPRSRARIPAVGAAVALLAGAAGLVVFTSPWSWLAVGLGLSAAGLAGGIAAHRHLAARESEVARRATNLLTGAESRASLTQSLAIRLDQLWEQCQTSDQEIVWHTVAMMMREYSEACDSGDRQSALMNLITLVGELKRRLSPWYVRHEKAVSFGVGIVGISSGVTSTIIAIAKALS